MTKAETKAAAKLALERFVELGRVETSTRDFTAVVYKEDLIVTVTFVATVRGAERVKQHTYSVGGLKFMYASD